MDARGERERKCEGGREWMRERWKSVFWYMSDAGDDEERRWTRAAGNIVAKIALKIGWPHHRGYHFDRVPSNTSRCLSRLVGTLLFRLARSTAMCSWTDVAFSTFMEAKRERERRAGYGRKREGAADTFVASSLCLAFLYAFVKPM